MHPCLNPNGPLQVAVRPQGMGLSTAAALRTHLCMQRLVGLLQVRIGAAGLAATRFVRGCLHSLGKGRRLRRVSLSHSYSCTGAACIGS